MKHTRKHQEKIDYNKSKVMEDNGFKLIWVSIIKWIKKRDRKYVWSSDNDLNIMSKCKKTLKIKMIWIYNVMRH